VTANNPGDSASVLLGNGDGTFQANLDFGALNQPYSVAVGDFNGDGRLDVAAPSPVSGGGLLLQVPVVSLSATSLTFANQVVGTTSPSQTVTLSNASVLQLRISSISVTGTNATDFRQTNTCGSGLPSGGSCTISVTFTPAQIGPRTASVTITDNAVGSPQSIALSGTGVVSGPNATLLVTGLVFGDQLVGTTSPAQSVTLSNYGTMALSFANIVATDRFDESNTCGSSLAAGASCTISVTFTPKQRGTRTGKLTVTDNAPGKQQIVSLTGTGTVVEFVPASLNFGFVKIGHSSTQTTTLTNTGSPPLSITGITISGNGFSQTNNCGSDVRGGKSCTISVTFKPTSLATFLGDVSVNDNGGGSPQQVPLSGSGTTRGASAAVRSALATTRVAAVPSPTGPSPVGTRVMDLVDSKRADPFLADGTKRELLVRFWYPASTGQGCTPAEYTSMAVWRYFSQLAVIPLPEVSTNSCWEAPITEGRHPVVVFTHGYTGTFTDYTFIFEDLASRGYVVASVDHTYEATAVEFPDGRLVRSVLGSHLANTWRMDDRSFSLALSVRSADLKFVARELERLNSEADSPFTAKLDTSRVGLMGHSLGGQAALSGIEQEAHFRAGVLIDGVLTDIPATGLDKAILILAAGREQWNDNERGLWDLLRGPRLAVNLRAPST